MYFKILNEKFSFFKDNVIISDVLAFYTIITTIQFTANFCTYIFQHSFEWITVLISFNDNIFNLFTQQSLINTTFPFIVDQTVKNFNNKNDNNNNNDNKMNNIGVIGGNGYTICSGSNDNNIRIWDIETTKQFNVFKRHTGYVRS
ncbi:mitochondrial GTPase, partial [Reticulomyxa filosa]